jgi:hypothetical protein
VRLALLVCALWLLGVGQAEASLCVCATGGDDSRSKATVAASYSNGSCSAPWATIGRAAWGNANRATPNTSEAAAAGDTVYVCAGSYTTTGTATRHTPAFNPVNAGSSGNPITFVAAAGVTVSYTSSSGPVIGCNSVDYITWRGWSLDEATTTAASDTGLVVLWDSNNCIVEYGTFDGNGDPGFGSGELHNAIRINAGSGHIVRNNTIHDVINASSGANASGILIDQSAGGTIEHNEIYDSGGGIFIKRNYTNEGAWTFRFNYIHDTDYGIRADQLTDTTAQYDTLIYQNLLKTVFYPFMSNHYETYETYDLKIVNNTVIGDGACVVVFDGPELTASADHDIWNNVATDCPLAYRTQQSSGDWSAAILDSQHNAWYQVTNAVTWDYEEGGQTTHSWATWVARPMDATSPASLTSSDPLFANAAGSDYRLCTGSGTPHASCSGASPAIALGVDMLDLDGDGSTSDNIPAGAYITGNETIGVGAETSGQPVRLRIRGEDQ